MKKRKRCRARKYFKYITRQIKQGITQEVITEYSGNIGLYFLRFLKKHTKRIKKSIHSMEAGYIPDVNSNTGCVLAIAVTFVHHRNKLLIYFHEDGIINLEMYLNGKLTKKGFPGWDSRFENEIINLVNKENVAC